MKFTCKGYMAPESKMGISAKKQYRFTVNSLHDGHFLPVEQITTGQRQFPNQIYMGKCLIPLGKNI
jgi:hypothetical protein